MSLPLDDCANREDKTPAKRTARQTLLKSSDLLKRGRKNDAAMGPREVKPQAGGRVETTPTRMPSNHEHDIKTMGMYYGLDGKT